MGTLSAGLLRFSAHDKQWIEPWKIIPEHPVASTSAAKDTGTPPLTNAATDQSSNRRSCTCMTYNVFSGSPPHSAIPHGSHRQRAAISLIRKSSSVVDVIALQEVSPVFEKALRQERWLRNNFAITSLSDYFSAAGVSASNVNETTDGCLLAIHKDILPKPEDARALMTPLPGGQGKVLIAIGTTIGTWFATSHFESLAANAHVRRQQFARAMQVMQTQASSVLMGDFNHSTYEELSGLVGNPHSEQPSDPLYQDVGFSKSISQGGASTSRSDKRSRQDPLRDNATFGELYPYFPGSRRKEKRKPRRLDLILVKGDDLTFGSYWTEGDKPIAVERIEKPARVDERSVPLKSSKKHKVRLKCKEGKNGHCYASDHMAVFARFVNAGQAITSSTGSQQMHL